MAKIGNVVDAETAWKVSQQLDSGSRPLIWPQQCVGEFKFDAGLMNAMPQRRLVHFLCLDEEMFVLWVMPHVQDDGNYSCVVYEFRMDYDFAGFEEGTVSPGRGMVYLRESSAEYEDALAKNDSFKLFKGDGLNQAVAMDTEEGMLLCLLKMAFSLELLAFSPLTVTKLKPTRRHLGDPLRFPREYAPIEIVNLRLPEKIDNPESAGRSITIRYWVTEHLRRIEDKKTGQTKLIKIKEHIRGPKDALLKPKPNKVYKFIH